MDGLCLQQTIHIVHREAAERERVAFHDWFQCLSRWFLATNMTVCQ